MDAQHWQEILRTAIGGRPLVLVGGARHRELADLGRRLGAAWIGDLGPAEAALGSDLTASFEEDWRGLLDEADPDRIALVLGQNFHPYKTFGSRRFVGTRRPEWRLYEDKPAMWELLAADGVDLGPWRVVNATADALLEATMEIDEGLGAVWAGDHRDGEHSGGKHVRVVSTAEQALAAATYFASSCDRVRVMPLLDGTPCSIHCFVSADEIAPMWPARVDVDFDAVTGTFTYKGADWMWSPSVRLTDSAQRFARRAAVLMRQSAGYRGVFCVDGVAADDLFLPTEINSRWGASLTTLATNLHDFGLRFIHALLADGHEADWKLASLVGELRSRA